MPNRIIKESAFTSDRIATLTDFEFRLWVGLITQADDIGRGDARPAIIKGRVFALRDRTTIKDIDTALHALAAAGCVSLYTVDGKPYYEFPSWAAHQRVRDAKTKFPGPEMSDGVHDSDAVRRILPQDAAKCRSNPIQSESESESESESKSKSKQNAAETLKSELAQIMAEWNRLPLTKIEKIDPASARGKDTKRRIAENGLESVIKTIGLISQSDFLMGQSRNRKNDWKCSFDWLMKKENFQKVKEGTYTDRQSECGANGSLGEFELEAARMALMGRR